MSAGYSTREVARLLKMPEHRVREFVRAGIVSGGASPAPTARTGPVAPSSVSDAAVRAAAADSAADTAAAVAAEPTRRRSELRFDFRDMLLLRMANRLVGQGLPPRRVKRALMLLKQQIRDERPLTGVQLFAEGGRLLASDGQAVWEPDSGQQHLRFGADAASEDETDDTDDTDATDEIDDSDGDDGAGDDAVSAVGTIATVAAGPGAPGTTSAGVRKAEVPTSGAAAKALAGSGKDKRSAFGDVGADVSQITPRTADQWFDLAMLLEQTEPHRAYKAYLRALEENPEHIEAHINIGRLCSAASELERAAAYFRQAIRLEPTHPVAHFNLAVTLHDLGELEGARESYRAAILQDPQFADAHYNLASLLQQVGDSEGARRHIQLYEAIRREEGTED